MKMLCDDTIHSSLLKNNNQEMFTTLPALFTKNHRFLLFIPIGHYVQLFWVSNRCGS